MKKNKSSLTMTFIASAIFMALPFSAFAANKIEKVEDVSKTSGKQSIMFVFKEPVSQKDFSSFSVGAPPKIAMEMKGFENSTGNKFNFERGPARSLSLSQSDKGVRVVVDLDKNTPHQLSVDGNKMFINFDSQVTVTNQKSTLMSSSFKTGDRGESRFVLKFDKSSVQANLKESGDFIYITAPYSSVDSGLLGKVDLSQDGSKMKSVDIKKDESGSALIVIEKVKGSSVSAYQLGDEYVVEIFETAQPKAVKTVSPSSGEGLVTSKAPEQVVKKSETNKTDLSKTAAASVQPQEQIKKEEIVKAPPQKVVVAQAPVKSMPESKPAVKQQDKKKSAPSKQASGKSEQNYSNQSTVSFNFQDVPLRTVIQLIAEESKMNVVVSDAVGGNITMNLVKVPWERALDIILRSKGLDKRKDGNLIWVGPQKELADYERAQSQARQEMEVREDTVTEYITVNYGNAKDIASILSESKAAAATAASSSSQPDAAAGSKGFLSDRGSVGVDVRTNTLIVSDLPKKIAEVKEMLKILDRPVDQVLIEARVVVASDSFARDLGAKFGVADRYPADPSNPGQTSSSGFVSDFTNAASNTLLNFNILGKNTTLDFELTAMQEQGKGEVVSNPRVITSNQKEAIIRQGEEIGYVTTQVTGTSTIPQSTVQFKEVLLELKVTPVITQDGRVFLTVGLKKDEVKSYVSTPSGDVPQIAKREVNTNVLIDNGQTLVIGGVYEFKNREDVGKVPFLGDIPFLGNLFKSTSKSSEKAELLVFITPKVMRPLNTLAAKPPVQDK